MRTIDVEQVIEKSGLSTKEVAKQLFPGNKYPKLALNRVISGEAFLDSNQISKLATLVGVSVSTLYTSGWKFESKKDLVVFSNESFRAELNTKTWITKIFDNDSLFHESVIHSHTIQLSEYIKKINLIINNKQNGKTN